MNSYVGVASDNTSRYVASANTYVANDLHYRHHNSEYHVQESMSTTNFLSLNAASNILPPFQIIRPFSFFRCIEFTMYLDVSVYLDA